MLPGPDIIRKCKDCQGLLKQPTIASGNTFGARFWTDGAMNARMLPRYSLLVKCPHCAAVEYLGDFEEVDLYESYFVAAFGDTSRDAEREANAIKQLRYMETPYAAKTTADDWVAYISRVDLPADSEMIGRLLMWRKWNDRRRDSDVYMPMSAEELANLSRLAELYDPNDVDQALPLAEIYRELGRFPEAITLLETTQWPKRKKEAAEIILMLAKAEDPQVCEIEERGDWDTYIEYRRGLRMAHRLNPPI